MKTIMLGSVRRQGGKLAIAVLLLMLVAWYVDLQGLVNRLIQFPIAATAGILLLLAVNLFVVSFRFWRVLDHFGFRLPWRIVSRASIAGHVAGLFVISLFGQVAGRQSILERHGVPVMVNSSLSAYERIVLALSSGMLCLVGAIFLLGQASVMQFVSSVSMIEIVLAWMLAAFLSYVFGRSGFEKKAMEKLLSISNIWRVAEIYCITLAGQVLVLLSFVMAIRALEPTMGVIEIAAAAAVISFAASLPITINGWGVREIASVFVLGHLGIPAADAVVVSVMVGLCSTLVIVLFIPLSLKESPSVAPAWQPQHDGRSVVEIERIAVWVLGMSVGISVFFQAHVELPGGIVNVNLADPLAVLALAAMALRIGLASHMPSWRIPNFNRILGLFSLLLCMGFINGWLKIGVTQWALGGRLIGWLVLLGYLSAGYFVISYFGGRGLRRFVETMTVTAVVIVCLYGFLRLSGISTGYGGNFEGFAGNRNAFAFQLLTVLAFLLVYVSAYTNKIRSETKNRHDAIAGILVSITMLGLIWTGSRAGWLAGAIMVFAALVMRWTDRRIVGGAVVVAALLWGIGHLVVAALPLQVHQMQSLISNASSDQERWLSFIRALEMWWQSPLLGAGLGVFLARSPEWFSAPLVVHSIPLWILAEFGLVGLGVVGWAFFVLVAHGIKMRHAAPANRILMLLLLMIAIFGLVHEMLYQRIFWLALGIVLASPIAHTRRQ